MPVLDQGFEMMFRLLLTTLIVAVLLPSITSAQKVTGPAAGDRIEDFSLPDHLGNRRKLSKLLSQGPVALVVIRSAGWCTRSKDQLLQLQRELETIEQSGLQVVGLSYDDAEVLKDFASLNAIRFPLLADPESRVIQQLGIVNTTRKKGTLRHKVAYPMTIVIKSDRTVASVVQAKAGTELHDSQQLIDAWTLVKPAEPAKKGMGFIAVRGNRFVDENGKQIIFKGLAIADPDKVASDGHWNREHFEVIKRWGASLIRIPVHPGHMRKRGLKNYLKLLDDAVRWCDELEMYVIIDWHSIGNLRTEKFESPKYRTSIRETLNFWDAVSKRFAGNPTVAFYEIFNEPSLNNGDYGQCSWQQWKTIVERCIDVIYANDKRVIPLVAGFNWAYDLREVKENPIDRPGIGYVAHPYPGKSPAPREAHWEEHFGFLANRFPIIVTEMGYYREGEYSHFIDDGTFRGAILKFLGKKKISWCVWTFDPDWQPSLIHSYDYRPTHCGAFFRDAMLGR